nr:VTT domain-containing protein [Deinococcus radiodurans]
MAHPERQGHQEGRRLVRPLRRGAVLFGRMVPGIRSLLSLPAGMSEMPLPKFLIYSAIGSALWSAALAYAGYALGENYDRVEQYVAPVSKVIVGLLVIGAAAWFIRRKREQGSRTGG